MSELVSHDALQLHEGLQRTSRPVFFDVETTGLNVRTDRILSLGFRLYWDGQWRNVVLFTERCAHQNIRPYISSWGLIRQALAALERPKRIVVGHNLKFDVLMLRREGVHYQGSTRDTQMLLRLEDQDRIFTKETMGRRYLKAPPGRQWSDYTLKSAAFHLLNVAPQYTPSANMDLVPYAVHATYLVHDLLVTHQLHDYLWNGLSAPLRRHYTDVQSPLAELLCEMRWRGVHGDGDFMRSERSRLEQLMEAISQQHQGRHGRSLVGISDDDLRKLLYRQYRLPYRHRRGKKPSVAAEAIQQLIARTANPQIQNSLELIVAYRESQSLHLRLGGYLNALQPDGRFHSQVDNRQASGRISSSEPNLQQIAAAKVILKGDPLEAEVRSRNLILPSPGCLLIAADVAQADVRVLGHEIDRCLETTKEHFQRLQRARSRRLPNAARLWKRRTQYINNAWQGEAPPPPPSFNPRAISPLVQNFLLATGDFYSDVAGQVTGRSIAKTDPQRGVWKTVLLAQINGETATGLANRWGCTTAVAQQSIDRFFAAYPDIAGWTALQRQQVALTGETYTWGGRRRRNSAHHWMVSEKRVRLLLVYKQGHRRWRYWFDVTPVHPTMRYLTCLVHRVWNVADECGDKPAKLIYELTRGRLGTKPYQHMDEAGRFFLPFRNIPWRNIRRVQRLDRRHQPVEMARYEGLDATCRPLINNIMQGGTVDVVTQMMLRTRQLCRRYDAHLLLNIHDELVYEVPKRRAARFLSELRSRLALQPGTEWRIPIVMEFKVGGRFGLMRPLP